MLQFGYNVCKVIKLFGNCRRSTQEKRRSRTAAGLPCRQNARRPAFRQRGLAAKYRPNAFLKRPRPSGQERVPLGPSATEGETDLRRTAVAYSCDGSSLPRRASRRYSTGVIDVRRLFGMGAIKMNQEIDMVIKLEPWDDTAVYDRLGLENTYTEILGVQLPALTIPVKPGRNLASIVEVAAMNNRNRKMGHNAALELTRRMDQHFARKMGVGDE